MKLSLDRTSFAAFCSDRVVVFELSVSSGKVGKDVFFDCMSKSKEMVMDYYKKQ